MLSKSLFIALLLAFASLSQSQTPAGSPDLVINIFRHGARAPLRDTYAEGWDAAQRGLLTSVGMREHYLLGRALADQYPNSLGQPYNLSKVYVRSSITERSINSAHSQLTGIYGSREPTDNTNPGPALNANPNYPPERAYPPYQDADIQAISQTLNNSQAIPGNFVTVPVDTTSTEGGINLIEPSTVVCFNLLDNIVENVVDDKSKEFWDEIAATRETLAQAGLEVKNPLQLGTLGDVFVCNYDDDRALPGNIDPQSQVYKNVTFARNWYFVQALWGSPQQRQLLPVPLFTYLFSYFDRKAAGATDLEFIFLSTAETNLIHLLTTLNIVTADCLMDNHRAQVAGQPQPHPNCNYSEFASNILLEFYNNNGSPIIVFKYNGVAIPLCSGNIECPYGDFKNLVSQATDGKKIQDYNRVCLEDSLPSLQTMFERAGAAFETTQNGITKPLTNARNDVNEARQDVQSGVEETRQDVRDARDSVRGRFDRFRNRN